jgi:hypothetical protein
VAAGVLQTERVQYASTGPCFVIAFLANRVGLARKDFTPHHDPWNAMTRRARVTGVVPPETALEILTRSNEPVSGLAAPKNVDVERLGSRWFCWRGRLVHSRSMKFSESRAAKPSGWRDLNPRPVAAATVLLSQAVKLVSTSSGLIISFSLCGFCASFEAFDMQQGP